MAIVVFVRLHKPETLAQETTVPPIDVRTTPASELRSAAITERIPGIITPENETILVAETSGTVSFVGFELGQSVSTGTLLATITNPNTSAFAKSGEQSDAIRNAEITASEARKAYKEAKRTAEKHSTHANDLASETARLRLESAEIALENIRDAHNFRSPISGTISAKNVNTGSTVSAGTILGKIALGHTSKVLFQISPTSKSTLTPGATVTVSNAHGVETQAVITAIAPLADTGTGRIPVEARLTESTLLPGTTATVHIPIKQEASHEESGFLIPLSTLTTSQNSSFLFLADNGKAKQVPVTVEDILGDTVRITGEIPEDAHIITDGNKRLENGTSINVVQ